MVEFKTSDAHKKTINEIYGKPVYPEVWDTEVDPKTGKLTREHMEECTGCALCEGDRT